jgi:hypothetical protein
MSMTSAVFMSVVVEVNGGAPQLLLLFASSVILEKGQFLVTLLPDINSESAVTAVPASITSVAVVTVFALRHSFVVDNSVEILVTGYPTLELLAVMVAPVR